MAALKKGPAEGKRPPKKGLRSRMPVKRSINLVLIDEHKISIGKALPSIVLIIALAVVFGKFLVADRLIAMSASSGNVSRLRSTLMQASESLKQYEGIEDTYAHLTYAGMTNEEMSRVDRVRILELVSTILPQGNFTRSWNVTGNILTMDITGRSLESLNELARKIEESPIVDSCAISTASKDEKNATNTVAGTAAGQSLASALENRREAIEGGLADTILSAMTSVIEPLLNENVQARFTIYLCQPPEPEETPEPEKTEEAEAPAETEAVEAAAETEEAADAEEAVEPEEAADAEEAVEPEGAAATSDASAEQGAPSDTAAKGIGKPMKTTHTSQPQEAVQATAEPEEVNAP